MSVWLVVAQPHHHTEKRFTCQNNLSQLGGLFVARRAADPAWHPRSGQALFLEWRRRGLEFANRRATALDGVRRQIRRLEQLGYTNILTATRDQLDLRDQAAVEGVEQQDCSVRIT